MTEPTTRQREAYEAMLRLGSQVAVGRELGLAPGSAHAAIVGYCLTTGTALPAGISSSSKMARQMAQEALERVPERMDAIEEQLAALRTAWDALAGVLAVLEGEIRTWTARQPIYVEMRPRHQRAADGGQGGVTEAKRLGRTRAALDTDGVKPTEYRGPR